MGGMAKTESQFVGGVTADFPLRHLGREQAGQLGTLMGPRRKLCPEVKQFPIADFCAAHVSIFLSLPSTLPAEELRTPYLMF